MAQLAWWPRPTPAWPHSRFEPRLTRPEIYWVGQWGCSTSAVGVRPRLTQWNGFTRTASTWRGHHRLTGDRDRVRSSLGGSPWFDVRIQQHDRSRTTLRTNGDGWGWLTGVGWHFGKESGSVASEEYDGGTENKGRSELPVANSDGGERPWQHCSPRKGGVAAGWHRCHRL
jgi:hypothetical protein